MPVVVNSDLKNSTEKINSIEKLRKDFQIHYESNNDLYDKCDAENVRTCNWTVERFLLANRGNEELAFKNLCDTLQWRKSFDVNNRRDDYFPDDFYKTGGIFQYNCDKDGLMLLYFRVCVHHKVNELSQYIKEFFVHNVNKIDLLSGSRKWAMVFDCSNGTLSNIDMDFSRYIINVLQNYFPKGFKYVLIYEMPWIMVAFWKITRTWLSEEIKQLIKFAKKEEIFNFIDAENLPNYIKGGLCLKSICNVPEGVKSAEELPHLNFTAEQIQRFRKIFKISSEITESEVNSNFENRD